MVCFVFTVQCRKILIPLGQNISSNSSLTSQINLTSHIWDLLYCQHQTNHINKNIKGSPFKLLYPQYAGPILVHIALHGIALAHRSKWKIALHYSSHCIVLHCIGTQEKMRNCISFSSHWIALHCIGTPEKVKNCHINKNLFSQHASK